MTPSLVKKLQNIADKFEETNIRLAEIDISSDIESFKKLSKYIKDTQPIFNAWMKYKQSTTEKEELQSMVESEEDEEFKQLIMDNIKELTASLILLDKELESLLVSNAEDDNKDVFLEIRAGTGGDEAGIFAGNLLRMYCRYAEKYTWQVEIISERLSEQGGYKEVIIKIVGSKVYAHLKFESGVHRVQRVPETESQGRVHTSACTVAVLPEAIEMDEVEIQKSDLRVDTFRASGAGGQHVNKTDSAIRLTHLPTGFVVECQDGRSQHKNKARAMSLLHAKLQQLQKDKQAEETNASRKSLVGSGDRSERIRTYNFSQSRVTDHRINLTLYKLAYIMDGDLEELLDALINEDRAQQLVHMESES